MQCVQQHVPIAAQGWVAGLPENMEMVFLLPVTKTSYEGVFVLENYHNDIAVCL